VSWHPKDPRSWGGWHRNDPRWGRHRSTWGWGHPGRPLYDNQLGHRLPTGGPPAAGQLSMVVAIGLFLLSPVTLFAWAIGQALLRVTGLRWWKRSETAWSVSCTVAWPTGSPTRNRSPGRSRRRRPEQRSRGVPGVHPPGDTGHLDGPGAGGAGGAGLPAGQGSAAGRSRSDAQRPNGGSLGSALGQTRGLLVAGG
jgi:hypothetical protein